MAVLFCALRTIGWNGQLSSLLQLVLLASLLTPLIGATSAQPAAAGSAYYVSTSGNDSSSGSISQPWRTLQKAANTAQAGDTVYVRAGTYTSGFSLPRSGNSGAYITFAAYPGEAPVLSLSLGGNAAFNFGNKSYIVLDGLTVDAKATGAWIEGWSGMHHNIIRNCKFRNAASSSHGVGLKSATYNKFQNNQFYKQGVFGEGGTDIMKLHEYCDHNLIEGNRFEYSEHSLFTLQGSYNVIRNNYFENQWEKISETNGVVPPTHNVWERNTFAVTKVAGDGQDSPGIQFSGPANIVRYNVFYLNQGGGLRQEGFNGGGGSSYSSQSHSNRVYNNVFYKNSHAGLYLALFEAGCNLSDNVYKNNIWFRNVHHESTSQPQQIYMEGLSGLAGNRFLNNDVIYQSPGSNVIGHNSLGNHPLSWWQGNYASNFSGNLDVDPKFVSESSYDFHLQSSSPLINKGAFLTKATASGSGTQIKVEDAGYFSDGAGLVSGDQIIVGRNSAVQISAVNYGTNTITVNRSIGWSANDAVSLTYSGTAPEMGAFEYGSGGPTPGPTPTATTMATPTRTPGPTPTRRPTATPGPGGRYRVFGPLVQQHSTR